MVSTLKDLLTVPPGGTSLSLKTDDTAHVQRASPNGEWQTESERVVRDEGQWESLLQEIGRKSGQTAYRVYRNDSDGRLIRSAYFPIWPHSK